MGSLGFGELFVIIVVASVIFGPNQLPDLARSLAKAVKDFKAMINRIDSDIKEEVDTIKKSADLTEIDEILKDVKETSNNFSELSQTINQVKAINPMKHPIKSANAISNISNKAESHHEDSEMSLLEKNAQEDLTNE